MSGLTIEELKGKIGQELGVSEWVLVDQAMIDRFADATGDHQFIHIDPELAKATPLGGTIAHGFLILSLMGLFMQKTPAMKPAGLSMALNYGGDKVRFLTPVPSGSRVRARFKLLSFDEKRPGQFQHKLEMTVEIEGSEKPALIAVWISLLFT